MAGMEQVDYTLKRNAPTDSSRDWAKPRFEVTGDSEK